MAVVKPGSCARSRTRTGQKIGHSRAPLSAVGRYLQPLGESAHVLVVGGPTNPNGDVYWQVADDAFPGCCAPFGWVRAMDASGQPALAPFIAGVPGSARRQSRATSSSAWA